MKIKNKTEICFPVYVQKSVATNNSDEIIWLRWAAEIYLKKRECDATERAYIRDKERKERREEASVHRHTHAPTPSQKPGVYVDKHSALPIPM